MSEDKSRKTEPATPKKLRDARKKGQVPKSKEVVSFFMLMGVVVYFWLTWEAQFHYLAALFDIPQVIYRLPFDEALKAAGGAMLRVALYWVVLPLVLIQIVMAVLGSIVQFGVLFSAHPIKPDINKINPVTNAGQIFSVKTLLETLLSTMKITVIGTVLYLVVRSHMRDILHDPAMCDIACKKQLLQELMQQLFLFILPLLLALAVLDYLVQKQHFLKQQRMSKEELKREFKDLEGDPLIKGARRQTARELSSQDIADRIKRSRVLVLGSRAAIALRYDAPEMPLPVILMIGKGEMIRRLVAVARKEKRPIVADDILIGQLLDGGAVDQFIPDAAITRTAVVLRRV
jgi:type III secretion protein U